MDFPSCGLNRMVVPLVVASVMSGIIGLGDVRKLGRPGGLAITLSRCKSAQRSDQRNRPHLKPRFV